MTSTVDNATQVILDVAKSTSTVADEVNIDGLGAKKK